jgi:hypothetical protein
MRRLAVACALLLAAAAASAGCATCEPEEPKVRPHVEGAIGAGSSGTWTASGVGFDVTNLFCRHPKPEPELTTEPGAAEAEDALPDPSTAQDPSHTVTPPHE